MNENVQKHTATVVTPRHVYIMRSAVHDVLKKDTVIQPGDRIENESLCHRGFKS